MEVITEQGFVWVGWGTWIEANLKLRNIEYPLFLLLTIGWFYYQHDLSSPAHIDTIANPFPK